MTQRLQEENCSKAIKRAIYSERNDPATCLSHFSLFLLYCYSFGTRNRSTDTQECLSLSLSEEEEEEEEDENE